MLRFFADSRRRHLLDDGRVFCPTRGHDVDFDLCAGCRQLLDIRLDATPPYVRCESELSASPLVE